MPAHKRHKVHQAHIEEVRRGIREMNYRSPVYKMLREELTARGYWRNLPRGNPQKGYAAKQRNIAQEQLGVEASA